MSFSENLRALRRSKNKTQEELSAALNVTPQTISKWERGESYPDFPLLPPLAAYFDVSLDELVGMAEYRSEERRKELLNKGRGLVIRQEKFMDAIPIFRDAITMFPGDAEIMFSLANALNAAVVHKMAPEADCGKYTDEAISLLERLIDLNTPLASLLRSTYLNKLVRIFKRIGEIEKANEIAKRQPRMAEGQEILLAELDDGSRKAQEDLMYSLYSEYDTQLRKAADRARDRGDTEKALFLLQKQLALGDWFFDDPRDAQVIESERWHLYGEFAITYAERGDTDSAMAWLSRAADSAVICPLNGVLFSGDWVEDEEERVHNASLASLAKEGNILSFSIVRAKAYSGLVKDFDIGYTTMTHPIDAITGLLATDRWDAIRADERFREIERRLKEARSAE
jgi:transcriptional regulator with XRE-family HTH domain